MYVPDFRKSNVSNNHRYGLFFKEHLTTYPASRLLCFFPLMLLLKLRARLGSDGTHKHRPLSVS